MSAALRLLVPLAWRNLWRNAARTTVTLAVVATGLYSTLCFAALLDAWTRSSREASLNLVIGSGQIHAPGFVEDPKLAHRMPEPSLRLVAALNAPEISAWSGRLRAPAVVQSEYKLLPVTLMGVDPRAEAKVSTIPHQLAQGRYLQPGEEDAIVLGRRLVDRLKTRIGKRVVVMSLASSGALAEKSLRVVGVFAGNVEVEDRYAYVGVKGAQAMLGVGGSLTEIAFDVPDNPRLGAVIGALQRTAPGLDVRPWTSLSPMAAAMAGMMGGFVYIWLGIMFALMAIGIINTQLMATYERLREFGLLQALGMRPRLIMAEVSIEALMLVGLGVAIGLLAAAATIAGLHRGVDLGGLARGSEAFGGGRVLHPRLDAAQTATLTAIVWGLGVLVALWPARAASRIPPAEAMRRTA
jgi:ABC-type lipoprotein release transport system permease subunit